MRLVFPAMILASAMGVGCRNPDSIHQQNPSLTKIQELSDQLQQQARQLAQKDQQLRDQTEMIQLLRGLGAGKKLEDLIHVDRIEIDRLSGGYDDDRNGIDDGVVVYLRLYDQYGGSLRASGIARIRLLDLAESPSHQQIAQERLDASELAPMWYGRFLTSHYTIKVPWAGERKHASHKDITVLVSFTDLLSGRTFHAQKVVEISAGNAGRP